MKHHFQSITLNRDYGEGFFNLALCLRDLGRLDEAVGCFGRALALNPDNRRARVELAIALLMRGELQEGFAAYETRKRLPETPTPEFSQPAWDGGPIRGKRILLYPEQGLGDVLLFVRFARELKRRGATVAGAVPGAAEGAARQRRLHRRAWWPKASRCRSSTSMPRWCRCPISAAPTSTPLAAEPPYLHAPAESRIKLGRLEKAKLRIGIYWAAMPGQPLDRQRSAPFAQFLALAGDPELLVFSLQGGAHQKDIQQHRRRRAGARCRPRHLRFRRGGHAHSRSSTC